VPDRVQVALNAVSQFLIQTGKRLFKGVDNYEDVHKMVFDIETTGLDPKKERIINIGVRDNKGFEHVLDVEEDNELNAINTFFRLIENIKPDIVTGYNSENFDFPFFEGRAEVAGYNIDDLTRSLLANKPMKRVKSVIKLGGETEFYKQTKLWGINVIDTYHAVRRFQAINSNLTKAGLKHVTKFSKINKENRVYVEGNIISKTYLDIENKYAFNDIDGDWYMITEDKPLKEGYEIVSGKFIVHRYLLDDLWETQEVDTIYNQANFLISKLIPTTFAKTATSGTASLWKLILQDFSYQKGLAIPSLLSKRKFVGGLSRLLRVGYVPNVVKFDFTSLYPTIAIRYNVSPDVDILNGMLSMLEYILDERITYKDLNKKYGKLAEKLEKNINGNLNEKELNDILKQIKEYKKLASDFDKKQLPLKILANSFFGSYGCQHIFNWGSIMEAETITCIGRQFFRIMVDFMSKKGFQPIVGDTDGLNFRLPDNHNEIEYVSDGKFYKNEKGEK
jgi:DNA polymerase elongation subunit (family B)